MPAESLWYHDILSHNAAPFNSSYKQIHITAVGLQGLFSRKSSAVVITTLDIFSAFHQGRSQLFKSQIYFLSAQAKNRINI